MPKSNSTLNKTLTKIEIDLIGYSHIYVLQDDLTNAFFYKAGMTIDADGSPHTYNEANTGLDWLANAGHPGDWWALVTDDNGNPIKQTNDDVAPGYYISTTALEDLSIPKTKSKRFVDSEKIPFFVLPSKHKWGQRLGDFGIIYNSANGKFCGAIYADIGPKDHLGEASIATANLLGINSNAKHGGQSDGVIYLVFPNSKKNWPMQAADIQSNANSLLTNWGGINKLKNLFGV